MPPLLVRRARTAASLLCMGWLSLGAPSASGQTSVIDAAGLRQAIIDANNGGDTMISIDASFTLNVALVPIAADITFLGNGNTISGGGTFQVFFVDSGTVSFDDMKIEDGLSQGGAGAARGGGGLGAGGGLFVNETAVVTLTDVVFNNNVAQGGSGGLATDPDFGGGGGGFHGDGGALGGGGGGYSGDGGTTGGGGGLEGDGFDNDEGCLTDDGGNGGGKFLDGDGGAGGGIGCGAPIATAGEAGADFEGGGNGIRGGNGGRFGGGGGSGQGDPGDGRDFGGGGGTLNLLGSEATRFSGGDGGFGGGGGGGTNETVAEGGFGAGNSSLIGPGGAGDSLGGAIFVRQGGSLTITITSTAPIPVTVTSNNSVKAANRGSGNPAREGQDVYLMSGVDLDIAVAISGEALLSGSIAGEGGISKLDPGTLVLGGANSYTGGTSVIEGTLRGNSASLQGDIDVATIATLEFDQSGTGTYSGVLKGGGDLVKSGGGTLTLSGANTYTGNTDVDAGTLRVSTGSLSAMGLTTVDPGATLDFNQGSNATFSGQIAGDGSLRKSGGGTLTLDADNSGFVGTTNVDGGSLSLPSALGGNVTVAAGSRIEGSGAVGGDLMVSGTVAGGTASDKFGTIDVGADLTMTSSATLEVRANASGQVNLTDVTGMANLDGGIDLLLDAGDYSSPLSFVVLRASSIAGTLADPADTCILDASISPAPTTEVTLTLSPDFSAIAACVQTSNQRAVGEALARNVTDPALADARENFFILSDAEIADALDQMSGEGLLGFSSARLSAGSQFMNTLSQRMRDPGELPTAAEYPLGFGGPLLPSLGAAAGRLAGSGFDSLRRGFDPQNHSPFSFVSLRGESGLGGWLDGFAVFAGIEGDGNSHDTDFNLYGTSAGIDYAFGQGLVVGAAVGYTRSKLSLSDVSTWGTGDTWQGALYGSYATDRFYVGGAARYAFTSMDTKRDITFGQLYERADGSFRGYEISTYLEAGLAAVTWDDTRIQPLASLLYTHLDQDEFTESTAPSVKLNIDSSNVDSYVSSLGVRMYRHFTMAEDADIVPELRIRWAHEFGDVDRDVAATFATTTVAPSGFTVKGAETGRDVAVIGLGWTVIGDAGTTLSLNYDATLNEDVAAHALTVGLLIHY